MRLPKLVPDLGPKAHAHGCDFYCATQSQIDASKLEPLGTFAEIFPRRRETGWYADLQGHEILNARVYAYGRKHLPDGEGGLDWYGDYHGYVAAVESSETDTQWLIAERHDDGEEAAGAAHDFAERLAETTRAADQAFQEALTSRLDLTSANDRRRAALQILREHGGLDRLPPATRALLDREWRNSGDERSRVFATIADKRPGAWSAEYVQQNWLDGWTSL